MNLNTEWLRPVWNAKKQYRETFLMVKEGTVCRAPFLYTPQTIQRVESYDCKNVYEEGKDYVYRDGWLYLTENSSIPCTGWDRFEYTSPEAAMDALKKSGNDVGFGPLELTDGKYLALELVGQPERITQFMVTVTYTTQEKWTGHVPENSLDRLPGLKKKLESGESLSVLVYGDSISCGWDCSGMYGQEPNQPIWPEILHARMEQCWQNPLSFYNTSVGGVDTEWAVEQVPERVTFCHPDLVILGFGMNDRCPGVQFAKKIQRLIEAIRKENPDAELVLVATTLPNPKTKTAPLHFWAHQDEYEDALKSLCEEGIVLANVQAVQKEMEKRKRYMDLTGNAINHPNDYLARVQVQVIAAVLGLESK